MKPTRNDPCPCGSGKKYKNCCLIVKSASNIISSVKNVEDPLRIFIRVVILIVVGFVIYYNSFGNPFIFDDEPQIVHNSKIRSLFPPWDIFANNRRPILYLSLAVNHALGGLQVWGYHFFNLVIHIGSSILLFAIIRRTLSRTSCSHAALAMSFAVSLLWLAHPLQTQSVTYIIQRAESLMGFFYLLTLYCVIRYMAAPTRIWSAAAITACALGMATKETMATAPVVILLYDRTFMAKSWKDIWIQRKELYGGLFATWGIVFLLLLVMNPETTPSAGFNYAGIPPWQYALTQPGVILHYLKLIVVPAVLVFDYNDWPVAKNFSQAAAPSLVFLFFTAALAAAVWKKPRVGFWGLWFLLILLPSSSVMPIADVAFEYRLYLPIAGILALIVIGIEKGLSLWIPQESHKRMTFLILTGLITLGLSFLTIQRNRDYRDELTIWLDTLKKRPNNPRAYTIVGVNHFDRGRFGEAEQYYRKALAINPNDAVVHNNLGLLFAEQDQYTAAKDHYQKALALGHASSATVHNNLGVVYLREKKYEDAIAEYEKAIKNGYHDAPVYSNYGIALTRLGRYEEAVPYFKKALAIEPRFAEARRVMEEAVSQLKKEEHLSGREK